MATITRKPTAERFWPLLFNSLTFLAFYVTVFVLYFTLPQKWRWLVLLVASYYFYMYWNPRYIILILLSSVLDFYIGKKLGTAVSPSRRKRLLMSSLFCNLGLLFVFKYLNFFLNSLHEALTVIGINVAPVSFSLVLPVGISFYTFQTLSYTIDVYREKLKPTNSFGHFALYVAFFPQLVAGPIERASHLLPQLSRCDRKLNYEQFVSGFTQASIGFFKKVVVADTLAVYVNAIYNNYQVHNSASLLLATYLFAFQIYCDFSGYSDIAIGTARMLGFEFCENFATPYFSKTVTEFWRRWHISLSSWLRDYLYIPLGGSRNGPINTYRNLLTTMLLGGLWHGASWNFVIWGALNGGMLSLEKFLKIPSWNQNKNIARRFVSVFICFHLICLTWIFFRSQSLAQAWAITLKFIWIVPGLPYINDSAVLLAGLGSLAFLFIIDFFVARKSTIDVFTRKKSTIQLAILNATLIATILAFGVTEGSVFIYFQF